MLCPESPAVLIYLCNECIYPCHRVYLFIVIYLYNECIYPSKKIYRDFYYSKKECIRETSQ